MIRITLSGRGGSVRDTVEEFMRDYVRRKDASRSKSWVDRLNRYKDFPKKLNHSNNDTAYWDRDEILRFFARHPKIPTTAQKYLKDKK